MAKRKTHNPAKFDRCVKEVKAKGSAVDPYAVCTAAGTRGNAPKEWTKVATVRGYAIYRNEYGSFNVPGLNVFGATLAGAKKQIATRGNTARKENLVPLFTAAGEFVGNVQSAKAAQKFLKTGKLKMNKGRRGNPALESEEAYADFHGRPSEETVVVEKQVHYHKHLAAAGKLEKLVVVSRKGDRVTLSRFKGAVLCFNERRTQLFVEGGDQTVNLREFGISPNNAHEVETLGDVTDVEYFTTKDHLGNDGGTAIYHHKFSKPYPELVYDVVNESLMFSGGRYVVLPEGIDN
jgi:hypothetical protein